MHVTNLVSCLLIVKIDILAEFITSAVSPTGLARDVFCTASHLSDRTWLVSATDCLVLSHKTEASVLLNQGNDSFFLLVRHFNIHGKHLLSLQVIFLFVCVVPVSLANIS